ncbi:MAG: hypothetical protein N3D10_01410 [Candidatus Micrarchaeota archaeon]|nr:hypothetical protein [Candidatus Micrarchaeota archaeon]
MIGIVGRNLSIRMLDYQNGNVYKLPRAVEKDFFNRFIENKSGLMGRIYMPDSEHFALAEFLEQLYPMVYKILKNANSWPDLRDGYSSFLLIIRGEPIELKETEFKILFYNEKVSGYPIKLLYSERLNKQERLNLGLSPEVNFENAKKLYWGRDNC